MKYFLQRPEKKHVTFHETLWEGIEIISQKDIFIPTNRSRNIFKTLDKYFTKG